MLSSTSTFFKSRLSDRRDHRESGDLFEVEALHATPESHDESNEQYEVKLEPSSFRLKHSHIWNTSPLVTASGLLTVLLLTFIAYQAGRHSSRYTSNLITPIPEFSRERRIISKDPVFSQPSSPEVDEAWASLVPTAHGFITIEDPESYQLPSGLKGSSGKNLYGVTWTHQYHCLDMLRVEFWKLLRNESSLPALLQSNEEQDQETLDHNLHCFDYLRQTLMCNMDMTIEWAARDQKTGSPKSHVNGWDIPHTCKNSQSVFDYMRKHALEE